MTSVRYQTAIIGAGAAGLKTAIDCARLGMSVLLLDGREKIGAKILMSGGTRCNVTNETVTEKDFAGTQLRAVRNILRAYPSSHAVEFFRDLGVKLLREEGGKFFPSTHSARTVLDALVAETRRLQVDLKPGHKVTSVDCKNGIFEIASGPETFHAKTVVLATGGLSYPATGSDGSGYGLAQQFGHTLVPTLPALTPFLTEDADFKKISGVSLECTLSLRFDAKTQIRFNGPLLFTHFGFSGPAALNMSRYWLSARNKPDTQLQVCFLPEQNEENWIQEIETARTKNPRKTLLRHLSSFLPERLSVVLMIKAAVSTGRMLNQLTRSERHSLTETLFRYALPVRDVYGYGKAEVTAGGVDLSEVNTQTLESKKQPGLFLVGEILDCDGRIGGFNFQWAWSTAHIAAQGIRHFQKF